MYQTICVEILYYLGAQTPYLTYWKGKFTFFIKKYYNINSQITKAHKIYIYLIIIYIYTAPCSPLDKREVRYARDKGLYINNYFFNSFSARRQYFSLNPLTVGFPILCDYFWYKGSFDFIRNMKMSEKWKIIPLKGILNILLSIIISKLVGISEAIRLIFIYIPSYKAGMTLVRQIKFTKIKLINVQFKRLEISNYVNNFIKLLRYNLYHLKLHATRGDTEPYSPLEKIEVRHIITTIWINYILNTNIVGITNFGEYIPSEEEDILEKENIISNQYEKEGNINNVSSDPFHEWLAGLIDGDGYFNLSKKGTARLNITMDIKDKKLLYDIKHKFGGSIYTIANANALRYQLSHKKGLIALINAVNGNIRNPKRMLQMNKLCYKYNINLIFPKPLTFNNGWLSGIIDSDGSIHMNVISGQIFLSITQKDKYILEPLIKIYSGKIRTINPKIEAFRYDIYRKNELFNLIDNYFNKYPLRSVKLNRLNLIKQFYLLRPYRNSKDIIEFNKWLSFKKNWDKFGKE